MKTLRRLRSDWLLATEISKLESRLWRISTRDDVRCVLVTSAVRGEGKSTTVAYLATSLGLYPNRRILAMDFDFRIPGLSGYFDVDVPYGIDRVLSGEISVLEAIIPTELPSLHLALPTRTGADPNLLLRTQDLLAAFSTLRESYDLILIDTPAIIPVSDATMLMPVADGVILTGMAGRTTEPQLRRAREICEGMDANVIGLVIGNVQEAAPDYVAEDYNYYGYHAGVRRQQDPGDSGSSA
jgi:capsular exopolysaccharide synthesis family protein